MLLLLLLLLLVLLRWSPLEAFLLQHPATATATATATPGGVGQRPPTLVRRFNYPMRSGPVWAQPSIESKIEQAEQAPSISSLAGPAAVRSSNWQNGSAADGDAAAHGEAARCPAAAAASSRPASSPRRGGGGLGRWRQRGSRRFRMERRSSSASGVRRPPSGQDGDRASPERAEHRQGQA